MNSILSALVYRRKRRWNALLLVRLAWLSVRDDLYFTSSGSFEEREPILWTSEYLIYWVTANVSEWISHEARGRKVRQLINTIAVCV